MTYNIAGAQPSACAGFPPDPIPTLQHLACARRSLSYISRYLPSSEELFASLNSTPRTAEGGAVALLRLGGPVSRCRGRGVSIAAVKSGHFGASIFPRVEIVAGVGRGGSVASTCHNAQHLLQFCSGARSRPVRESLAHLVQAQLLR